MKGQNFIRIGKINWDLEICRKVRKCALCLVSLKSISLIGMVRRPSGRPFSGEVTWQSANWQSANVTTENRAVCIRDLGLCNR